MADKKILDTLYHVPRKRGNGLVRSEAWANSRGDVTHYNLAYINHSIFYKDNGRVVGYDNSHHVHHRHYMGKAELIHFTTFDEIQERFLLDWTSILEGA